MLWKIDDAFNRFVDRMTLEKSLGQRSERLITPPYAERRLSNRDYSVVGERSIDRAAKQTLCSGGQLLTCF